MPKRCLNHECMYCHDQWEEEDADDEGRENHP